MRLVVRKLRAADAVGVVFLFPGQGAQYVGMAAGLCRSVPALRERIDECLRVVEPLLGRDLRPLLFADDDHREEAGSRCSQSA